MIENEKNEERVVREQKLLEYGEKVDAIRDKLNEPIDSGIRDTLIGLMAHKVNTTQSCEGHNDRAEALPWVDIGAPEPKGWEEDEKIKDMWRKWNKIQTDRASKLLGGWYESRVNNGEEMNDELKLGFTEKGIYGAMRLEPAVQQRVTELDQEGRKQHAPAYREEMSKFGDYLKKKFLEEGQENWHRKSPV